VVGSGVEVFVIDRLIEPRLSYLFKQLNKCTTGSKPMAEMLAGIGRKFLMSINDTEFIRRTCWRFTIEEVESRWNASPTKKK
jgi:hypothetical protein